ncbi:MAG: AAA family ATPase [Acutalibacteraceae bacterium]|nr:AAA family ATPase [Acutalibacteraceae bacterium]
MSVFEKATRRKAKLRMALTGVSGAGKTLGALYIAYGITGDWGKIALIDTEHERARFYANRSDLHTGEFLYASMMPPYSPERYRQFVEEGAAAVGSDGVVIVDSFSHAWNNTGGVLDIKDKIAEQQGKNSYTAWSEAGKIQNHLVNTILSADCHTIVTMRSKMDYAMQENDRGKMQPVKVGLAPVQRDDTEYEFDVVLDIARNHIATASKDTTFLDTFGAVITPALGTQLRDWLDSGTEPDCCEICGKAITAKMGRTAQEIIEAGLTHIKKKCCYDCFAKEYRERKKAEKEDAGQNTNQA